MIDKPNSDLAGLLMSAQSMQAVRAENRAEQAVTITKDASAGA